MGAEVRKEKYIHTLRCSTSPKLCGSALNREETLSVQCLKTFSNSSDVDQHSGKSEQDLRVPVLNMRGEPLMPTTPRKARILLEQSKAKVVQRNPFIIQLSYATGETKQSITLGVDSAHKFIGLSAVTESKELFSAEVILRNDVSKKLTKRRMYRRNRRNRLRYRKQRFLNRARKNSWLAPSIQHKLDSHLRLVEKIKKLLPISKVIVEVSSFDTQKMVKPEISGVEYQHGTLFGYEVWQYLLEKWRRRCAYCGKENVQLEKEHITPRIRGGTDRVDNLTISCHRCNQKKGNMTAEEFGYPEVQKQAKDPLKASAFMNIVRWKLVNNLKELHLDIEVKHTYGSFTKHQRNQLGLKKSHINDAFVIAGGNNQERAEPYYFNQVRRNNRSLQINRKGFKPSIRRQRYALQPNDLVEFEGNVYKVASIFSYGKWIRIIGSIGNIFNKNIKNVELICYEKGIF